MQVTDPVCGMSLESTKAAATEVLKDSIYYFCSESCRAKFRAALERYAERGSEPAKVRPPHGHRA